MLIKGEKITMSYDKKVVVKDIDIEIKVGEIITLVGPNGCGKSTLLKGLARLKKLDSGVVYIEGDSIQQMKAKTIAKKMAVLPQLRDTPDDFDVETLIKFGRYPHGSFNSRLNHEDEEIIKWAMQKTGMSHHRHKKLTQLSGGERQRAWIAMALAQKTEIIILDEPTTFLDLSHQLEVLELVKELNESEGVTILMVLHDLNQAIRYSDRIYVMQRGEIVVKGQPEEVIMSQVLKDVFKVDSDFYHDRRHDCNHFIAHRIEGTNDRGCPYKGRKEV